MEQRKTDRRRVLKKARLSYKDGAYSIDCVLRNVTEEGAYIDFPDATLVPDKFRIHNELDGFAVDCEVVRRRGNSAGVKFVGEIERFRPKRVQVVGQT